MGVITGPHGVRGRVRIKPFTALPEDVAAYGPVVTADGRRFDLAVEGRSGTALIGRIEGLATRTDVETFKGLLLFVPRAALPETEDEEFYHADLIGLDAVTVAGTHLGRVIAVQDFGAGDLIEVAAGGPRTLLVPFTRETVPDVDLPGGRLVCDLPDGFLEQNSASAAEEEEHP